MAEYFTQEEFDTFLTHKGESLVNVSEEQHNLINSIHTKSLHLAGVIQKELDADIIKNAPHVINPSKNSKIKNYLWYRIIPNSSWDELGIALIFAFDNKFCIRFDSHRWDDKLYKRKQLLEYRNIHNLDKFIEFPEIIAFGDYETLAKKIIDYYNLNITLHQKKIVAMANTKVGLLASHNDSNWKNQHIQESNSYNYSIIWNSSSPTGTNNTEKELRETINRFGYFNFYYLEHGKAVYKAEVIDFAKSNKDLAKWNDRKGEIYGFEPERGDYTDGNKSAKIIFLCSSFSKLTNAIAGENFSLFDGRSLPRQHNLTPFFMNERIDTLENIESSNNTDIKMHLPKNQILFGPPGTGKTYNTINKAIEIANPNFIFKDKTRKEIIKEFQDLKDAGQIVFTTFHQSMSYEDFVEGIKPVLSSENELEEGELPYMIEDGIFKRLCIEGTYEYHIKQENSPIFEQLFNKLSAQFQEKFESEKDFSIPAKAGGEVKFVGLSRHGNFQLIHREGNNTFTVSKTRLKILFDEIKTYENFNSISNTYEYFTNLIGGHNATLYWAVLNQIFKLKEQGYSANTSQQIVSNIDKKEVFEDADEHKFNHKKEDAKNYVLIIDEINRGNVSAIFGELITLLEEDKRFGKEEQLSVVLPYSKKKFRVPKNLYIIGTMNTADRSVEALDTALRRRFHFEEMPPIPSLIKEKGKSEKGKIRDIDLVNLLEVINKRINVLLDRDHLIGHSYFMKVKDLDGLKKAFKEKIIPLLQEYFYGDYGKISLVLGEGFCTGTKEETGAGIFANVANYDANAFSEKVMYEIVKFENNEESNKDENFIKAINTLLKNDTNA